MTIFDTHAHFDEAAALDGAAGWMERAETAGVTQVLAVGGSDEANRTALEMAARWPGRVRAAVGFDRGELEAPQNWDAADEALRTGAAVAVGETGLDYHYQPESAPTQRDLFARNLDLAVRHARPVVVHSREAEADTLALLETFVGRLEGLRREAPGVLHCFTGGLEFAQALVGLGFHISFSGILTFRNAEALRDVATALPRDRVLVETDAPYLAPVPFRGKPNEPAHTAHVVACLADLWNLSPEATAALTAANAERLFG